jgi:hypothetical protein
VDDRHAAAIEEMTQALMGTMGKAKPNMLVSFPVTRCALRMRMLMRICAYDFFVVEAAVAGFHGALNQVKPD